MSKQSGKYHDCSTCEARCPDLMPANGDAWQVLQAGLTQVRVGGMGGTIGFDYVALKLIADSMFIELSQGFWKKTRAVENIIRKLENQRSEESAKRVRPTKRR